MNALDAQIAMEREELERGEGAASGSAPAADDGAAARRAKDAARKRAERAAKGAGGGAAKAKPSSSGGKSKPKEKDLDPRVVRAVEMCMAAMLVPEVTPAFRAAMAEALQGALQYEIEARLPLLAEGYEPEVGFGAAIVGAGVTQFRFKRWEARERAAGRDPAAWRPPEKPQGQQPAAPPDNGEGGGTGGAAP